MEMSHYGEVEIEKQEEGRSYTGSASCVKILMITYSIGNKGFSTKETDKQSWAPYHDGKPKRFKCAYVGKCDKNNSIVRITLSVSPAAWHFEPIILCQPHSLYENYATELTLYYNQSYEHN